MADTKISALTAATTLADTDELVLASAGASKKITGANLKASMPVPSAGALTLLSTTTIAGSAAAFDVSSISGAYNDLLLMLIARVAASSFTDQIILNFNGDSVSGHYGMQTHQSSGSSVLGSEGNSTIRIVLGTLPGASAPAGYFGPLEVVIPGYASTTWVKSVLAKEYSAADIGASNKTLYDVGGHWNQTAAINRVQIATVNTPTTFAVGSQLRIYGRT